MITQFPEQCYQLVSVQLRTISGASDLSQQEENPLSFIIMTEKSEKPTTLRRQVH